MLGWFILHLCFRKCKIVLSQNADKLRAKLEWLYEVVLKYVGAYLILFCGNNQEQKRQGSEMCGRNVIFSINNEFFCFSLMMRIL